MGLRAEFTVFDLGYPEATEELGLFIDYSEGCSIFIETFLSVATALVPVDTGYLRSTLDAYEDGEGCVCETSCDYAQYVEYGTVYMGAQPYFEPAIWAALDAAVPAWDEALEFALEEEEELLEEMEEEEKERSRSRNQGFMGFIGNLFGMILGAIVIGFMTILSDILSGGREISYGGRSSFSGRGGASLTRMGGDNIEIEIT